MKLFDSHAHIDIGTHAPGDVQKMLNRAWDADLVGILAIAGATKVGEYGFSLSLAASDPRIWAAAGIHPHAASFASPDALSKLRFTLDHERIMALGEIGLDYHYNHSSPTDQRRAFIAQLRMAHDARLPVIVHTREADQDTISILQDEGANQLGGVIHCFSSTPDVAAQAVELGFFISFSGIVTFPKADPIQKAACQIPIDRILAETDTPFLSPMPHRGKPNEPARVLHVVEKLAQLREIDVEEMADITVKNTFACFALNDEPLS